MEGEVFNKAGLHFLGGLPGDNHLCQFYHQKEDLLEAVVPYFKAGLGNGEYCLWVLPSLLDRVEAINALKSEIGGVVHSLKEGQLEITSEREWYFYQEKLDLLRARDAILEKLTFATERGYTGVRGAGGIHRMESSQWKIFLGYESEVHQRLKGKGILALCTYNLAHCPLVNIPRVIRCHHRTFLKKGFNWEVV